MSLRRDFKATIKAHAEQDGAFREALLKAYISMSMQHAKGTRPLKTSRKKA